MEYNNGRIKQSTQSYKNLSASCQLNATGFEASGYNMDMDPIIRSSSSHLKHPHEEDKEDTPPLWPAPKHTLMNGVLISPLKSALSSKKELPDFGKKKVSLQYILWF